MSLKEAYQLAHSAECRLHLEAHRPDRNLRFVVGHLMHYEALRLRIVEIEHDVSQSDQASQVKFQGTGHVESEPLQAQRKPSTGQLGRRSPPPPPANYADDLSSTDSDDSDEFADEMEDSEGDIEGLVLERFPSASTKPPRPSGQGDHASADPPPADAPPPLEADTGADEDEDDPPSPEDPDEATLAQITKGPGDTLYPQIWNGMRKCPCLDHNKDCPEVGKMWMLPQGKDGKMRAVAEIQEVPEVQ